jgi:hypothetical protein
MNTVGLVGIAFIVLGVVVVIVKQTMPERSQKMRWEVIGIAFGITLDIIDFMLPSGWVQMVIPSAMPKATAIPVVAPSSPTALPAITPTTPLVIIPKQETPRSNLPVLTPPKQTTPPVIIPKQDKLPAIVSTKTEIPVVIPERTAIPVIIPKR